MRRNACLLAIALASAMPAVAQSPAAVSRGTAMRLTLRPVVSGTMRIPSMKVIGSFAGVRNDTVFLTRADEPVLEQWYSARDIQLAERSMGKYRPYSRGALIGGVTGIVVGYAGSLVYRGMAEPTRVCSEVIPTVSICETVNRDARYRLQGVALGMSTGILTGLVMARKIPRERWVTIDWASLGGR